jgi:hypothetical protein
LGEEDAVESLVKQCNADPAKAVTTSLRLLKVAQAVQKFLGTPHRSRAVTRIAHARLLAIAIDLTQFPEDDKTGVLKLWEKISFRVFGLCRKDARTQVGEYVRLAWDCLNRNILAGEVEERLLKIGSDDREHSIDWAVETVKNTNCYEGWEEELRYLMYRYEEDKADSQFTNEQWRKIWEESSSHSIEHIQAQDTGAAFVHRLGNLMLLPPGLNTKLSDRKPIDKVKEYRDTGLYSAAEVASTIEEQGWGLAQVEEREQKLLDWVRQTWA